MDCEGTDRVRTSIGVCPGPACTGPARPVAVALHDSAEALRLANVATGHGLVEVVDLYAALGSVTTLVDRLPPVLLFVQRCALADGTAGLRDDTGRDPGERLLEFVAVLSAAHAGLVGAARALGRGHAALSHLSHTSTSHNIQEET